MKSIKEEYTINNGCLEGLRSSDEAAMNAAAL